jgi:hypothetical protein
MDSDLHHRLWNLSNYHHTHQKSSKLIRTCGRNGFKIILEKGVPTFINRRTSSTVIDLTWSNYSAFKFIHSCSTSLINFGSDHQAIILQLNFNPHPVPSTRLSLDLKCLDVEKLCVDLSRGFSQINTLPLSNADDIDIFVKELTSAFQNSINQQRKTVNINKNKAKSWWDKDILLPIVWKRNQARKWMLVAHLVQVCNCYHHWQKIFKQKVFELKRNHWRKFLAESKDHQIFKA